MADPVHVLTRAFQAALAAAFGEEHASADPAIRKSTHADYQANAAMALAKKIKRPPRDVAAAILEHLRGEGLITKTEIAGPGFINVWIDDAFLAKELAGASTDPNVGLAPAAARETVVIDYSSPNVAKEMHVGHLRSTIIGDALARVLSALGHDVIRQNHLGDWGTPFGMLIEHLLDLGAVDNVDQSISDLDAFYRAARKKFDDDPAFADRSRRRVVLLQGGDEATLALWRKLVDASKRYLVSGYQKLGVTLGEKDFAGESLFNPMLQDTIAELQQKGMAVENQGALCVFPPGFSGRDGEPLPLIVRKQDGGYGYATTDLAAIKYRIKQLGATRVIYVVGAPQAQHLGMIFAAAKQAGWLAPPARAEHVAFGSVLGPDKKMFKTRSGDTVRLMDLIDEGVEQATKVVEEKSADLDPAERAAIARAVGVGAIKYADLSSDRVKDYVFEWSRMLALQGNTAPYMMYAHARCRSILRKAGAEVKANAGAIRVVASQEKELAKELLRFGTVVEEVADTLQPHLLCTYLYELATAFTSFWDNCPVLNAETAELRASRLALTDLTARVLARGLDLLGIEAPDRM